MSQSKNGLLNVPLKSGTGPYQSFAASVIGDSVAGNQGLETE
jgi:hypothetical protein